MTPTCGHKMPQVARLTLCIWKDWTQGGLVGINLLRQNRRFLQPPFLELITPVNGDPAFTSLFFLCAEKAGDSERMSQGIPVKISTEEDPLKLLRSHIESPN